MRSLITQSGTLAFGKYKGSLAYTIARTDPDYLRWALDTIEDLDPDDVEMVETLLAQVGNDKARRRR